MTTRKLSRLNISRNDIDQLEKEGYNTLRDILFTSPIELFCNPGLSLVQYNDIITKSSSAVMDGRDRTVFELIETNSDKRPYLSTGVVDLDNALRGGWPSGSITEICGPPGI
eukprot:gene41584-55129_t